MRQLRFLAVFCLLSLLLAVQLWRQPVPLAGGLAQLRALTVCLLMLAAAAGLGRAMLAALNLYSSTLFEELSFSLGLGLGALSMLGFGLGAAGVLNVGLAWLLLGAILLLTLGHLEHFAQVLKRKLRLGRLWETAPTEVALLLSMAWCGLGMLTLALAPVSFYDALVYHLAQPLRTVINGSMQPQAAVLFSWLPGGAEQLWALALALDNSSASATGAAALLNLAACAILVVAVTDATARYVPSNRQFTGPALLLAQPLLALAFAVFSADGWAALFAFLSTYAFLLALEDQGDRARASRLLLSFLLAGMAASMKPVAGMQALVLVILCLGKAAVDRHWRRPWPALGLAAALLLPLLPWLLRGWLLKQNPIYPFGLGSFGLQGAASAYFEHLNSFGNAGTEAVPFWRLPWALTFESGRLGGGGHLSPIFLGLLPALAWLKLSKEMRWLAFYVVLSLPVWSLGPRVLRYYLPFVPALCVLAAVLLAELETRAHSRGWTLALRGLLCGACFLGASQTLAIVAKDFDPFLAALGGEAREPYLQRMGVQTPKAGIWLKSRLGARARGLLLGDSRSAYLPSGTVVASAFEEHPAAALLSSFKSPDEVAGKLRQKGYDFVLVNLPEWSRVASQPGNRYGYFSTHESERAFQAWLNQSVKAGGDNVFDQGGVTALLLRP